VATLPQELGNNWRGEWGRRWLLGGQESFKKQHQGLSGKTAVQLNELLTGI